MPQFPHPIQPLRPAETGINQNFLINLTVKIISTLGTATSTQVSGEIKLSKAVVNALLDEMVKLQLIESRGLESSDIRSNIRYSLSDKGNAWAFDALKYSQYIGPAPVTLEAFIKQVADQSIKHEQVHSQELRDCLSHLVLQDAIMLQLGPAANSAKSVLLYGDPGNGKTSIAEALGEAFNDTIYIPHAIIVGNQTISFFDETIHKPVDLQLSEGDQPLDQRWVHCKRPVVITGGELTLNMLDLIYNPQARFYEAPVHLKALGGIFIIDDFGRQQTSPREILNRWIVPLEKGHDYLSLHTGKKFMIPFDQLVIFSTNMQPDELSDGAALRRIYFKIKVPSPTKQEYLEIFKRICLQHNLPFEEQVIDDFFDDYYVAKKLIPSGAHPGFLADHIIASCIYHDKTPQVSREMLELAWTNVAASSA